MLCHLPMEHGLWYIDDWFTNKGVAVMIDPIVSLFMERHVRVLYILSENQDTLPLESDDFFLMIQRTVLRMYGEMYPVTLIDVLYNDLSKWGLVGNLKNPILKDVLTNKGHRVLEVVKENRQFRIAIKPISRRVLHLVSDYGVYV